MKLRLTIFALMLVGLPVFWLFDLPHYLYLFSFLSFTVVVQSVIGLLKTQQKVWWWQVLFYGLITVIGMYFSL